MNEMQQHHGAIRAAWKKGKRKVTLKFDKTEIVFDLVKQVKKVVYWEGPQNAKVERNRIDTNVVARPADGSLLPRLNTQISTKQLDS